MVGAPEDAVGHVGLHVERPGAHLHEGCDAGCVCEEEVAVDGAGITLEQAHGLLDGASLAEEQAPELGVGDAEMPRWRGARCGGRARRRTRCRRSRAR